MPTEDEADLAHRVHDCLKYGRMGTALLYACAALFLYDYTLTVYDELRNLWKPRRLTITSITFLLARYPLFVSTIMILLPAYSNQQGNLSLVLAQINTVLRLLSIVASEFILAVRTWAIWEKTRTIFIMLSILSVSAVAGASVVIAKDLRATKIDPAMAGYGNCRAYINSIESLYVVPYVLTILYEAVTLTLSLIRITRWRRRIPERMRAPLLDTLWRDGVFYFSWTLVLGFMNIAVVTQSKSSQFRSGAAQLQAVIHSILSCRVVLHLAGSKTPKEINTTGCSLYTNPAIQFTTRMEMTESDMLSAGTTTDENSNEDEDEGQNHDRRHRIGPGV